MDYLVLILTIKSGKINAAKKMFLICKLFSVLIVLKFPREGTMYNVSPIKISELASILEITPPVISKRFKDTHENTVRSNNRIVGITPEGIEEYFRSRGQDHLYRTFFAVISSVCGGTQKTSSSLALMASARRMTSRQRKGGAVILLDTDSQASSTETLLGSPIPEGRPVLIDYLEGKCSLEDILTPVGDPKENMWVLGSSLNNIFLEKHISSPARIKNSMKKVFDALILHFGEGIKVFVDTAPQLSSCVGSALAGLVLLQQEGVSVAHLLPNRGDSFSISGNVYSINERDELLKAFNLSQIPTTVFLSCYDARLKVSVEVMKRLIENKVLEKHLSPVVIRYCSAVAQSNLAKTSIFTGKTTTASEDYTQLLLYILGFEIKLKGNA
jgi:cellulose biosynthesis protein BcsQ